jgi:hypothetical protein
MEESMMGKSRRNPTVINRYLSKLLVFLALFMIACISLPQASFAGWVTDPDMNIAVTALEGTQCRPQVIYDGSGGYFVTWRDTTVYGIYAQHYNSKGNALWDEAGAIITTSDSNSQVEAVADGSGGLIISWTGATAVMAQHLDADGLPLMDPDGTPVINGDEDAWICSDGDGGAIIFSYDGHHVTRLDADNNLPWGDADNALLVTSSSSTWATKIVSDGQGGAILVWLEYDELNNTMLAVQRVDGDGNFLWNDGDPFYLSTTGYAECPRIASSNNGGALVIWYEDPDGYGVYGQKIDADGEIQWDEGGVLIDTMADLETDSLDVAYDGTGGGFFTWEDSSTIYAQYVDESGAVVWESPVMMSILSEVSDIAQHPRKTIEDGEGGFITAWYNDTNQVKAQRCNAEGSVYWTEGGAVLSNGIGITYGPKLASNGRGGAVAVWIDNRGVTGQDVYIQGISADGDLGNPGYTSHHHSSSDDDDDNCFIDTTRSTSGVGILLLLAAWVSLFCFTRKEVK